jgi:uncharacterized protein (TIGR03083 family)
VGPTCPAWTADDLLWHLAEVQWFWGTVVREQVSGPEATKLKPSRPAGGAALWDFYIRASHDLGQALASASPDDPAWTWSSDQTVGFIRRRQAHEALIHRVDAELTAGDRTPMHARLNADGIDEALRIMYGVCRPWPGSALLPPGPFGYRPTTRPTPGWSPSAGSPGPTPRTAGATTSPAYRWRMETRASRSAPRWQGMPQTSTAGCGTDRRLTPSSSWETAISSASWSR